MKSILSSYYTRLISLVILRSYAYLLKESVELCRLPHALRPYTTHYIFLQLLLLISSQMITRTVFREGFRRNFNEKQTLSSQNRKF